MQAIHTRRSAAWANISERDGALLDFLRNQAKSSELSPEDTVRRTLVLMQEDGRHDRLLKATHSEPPRVRAMLGAIREQLGKPTKNLQRLHASLNPLSRFDFGMLAGLAYGHNWQAKESRKRETIWTFRLRRSRGPTHNLDLPLVAATASGSRRPMCCDIDA